MEGHIQIFGGGGGGGRFALLSLKNGLWLLTREYPKAIFTIASSLLLFMLILVSKRQREAQRYHVVHYSHALLASAESYCDQGFRYRLSIPVLIIIQPNYSSIRHILQ